jgi:hypothetical protein
MTDLIIYYIFGALTSAGIITIWNFSSISIHLLSWLYKDQEIETIDEMADAISDKHPNISELLYCPTCLGFWVSIITATTITLINDLSYWFIASSISWAVPILISYYHFYDGTTKK